MPTRGTTLTSDMPRDSVPGLLFVMPHTAEDPDREGRRLGWCRLPSRTPAASYLDASGNPRLERREAAAMDAVLRDARLLSGAQGNDVAYGEASLLPRHSRHQLASPSWATVGDPAPGQVVAGGEGCLSGRPASLPAHQREAAAPTRTTTGSGTSGTLTVRSCATALTHPACIGIYHQAFEARSGGSFSHTANHTSPVTSSTVHLSR